MAAAVAAACAAGSSSPGAGALQSWYETANSLESQLLDLTQQAQSGARRLQVAQREAAEAKKEREEAAAKLPAAKRAKNAMLASVADTDAALRNEVGENVRRARDNKGLQRTLNTLQKRLGRADVEVAEQKESVARCADLEDASEIEERSLQRNLGSMSGGVRRALERRTGAEREKRLELEAEVKAKLERVERAQEPLRDLVKAHEKELELLSSELAAQEARTRDVKLELAKWREKAKAATLLVQEQQQARKSMQQELIQMQHSHDQLQADYQATVAELAARSQYEATVQKQWRMKHIQELDARIDARRRVDKDITIFDESGKAKSEVKS
eukprot:gnl/TRDRNA2_/TRDRNA2_193612_c0_seq1.p1 gnl/TRDRNA2_/TRDRNA2_193612_c0~~gnl/TRDRNA2_/TRDRNA2_193612_c0_seq1.p1  ORF type:complete len:330 (+),score=86.81 gnl/TRDRNA2_/TRDRNA2_193612_c0_seq1:36-1025(+)